jgi:outer membrane protein assembly factor BamB
MKNICKSIIVIATVIILIYGTSGWAQDWPQWRGPNRDGKLAGFVPPATWPKALNQKWTVPVGLGDSSPALVGGKLYTFGRQDADEIIRCIDPASGKVLWQEVYPAQFVATGPSGSHPGPRSSPVVVDGKICALGIGGILSCLDAATGKLLWRKQSAADYLDTPYQFESSMSPIVVDGTCIVYIGGKDQGALIGFDLNSGQAKWKYTGNAPSPSSPVIMTVDGVTQIVTINEKEVIGVSLNDHSLLWSVPFKSRPVNSTTPVINGQTVYVTGQEVGMLAIKVTHRAGNFEAETLWLNSDAQTGSPFTTPVLREGLLFGHAANKLICLHAQTGQVLWTDASLPGRAASIVDAGSCLIALGIKGEMSIYQPSGKQFIESARYQVGAPEIWAHPIISGNSIFIRDKESVTLWTIE